MTAPLNVLSLFAGIGGLDLGLERAGMRVVGQVEIDPYCQRVLAKHWPDVPRHDDVRTAAEWWLDTPCPSCIGTPGYMGGFIGDCWCRRDARTRRPGAREGRIWRWPVDVICGGFPCQDISSAGKRAGIVEGERSSLWTYMAATVRRLQPRYVLVENVPRVLTRGRDGFIPAEIVAADLAALGYDLRWDCVSASAVGAPHRRDRWFGIAYTDRDVLRQQPVTEYGSSRPPVVAVDGPDGHVADPHDEGLDRRTELPLRRDALPPGGWLWPDANRRCAADLAVAYGAGLPDGHAEPRGPHGGSEGTQRRGGRRTGNPWAVEPDVGRVADGIPARVDRLRALGNSVVPQVAEYVGRLIVSHAEAVAA